ncbi:MAG: transposase [Cyanobacteria bacterium P01_C01_bin.72]
MRIIGLDVGRGSAVLCCLDELPQNLQQHYKKLKRSREFLKLSCDSAGVDKLLSLAPDAIILEPTGHWYSSFWSTVARQNSIDVFWMGHVNLDKLRGSFGFTNKRDEEDALCLAASYFNSNFVDQHGNQRFLNYYYDRDFVISRVRELFLEKEQLQKVRTSMINQLRQRLALDYPEAVKATLQMSDLRGFTPLIGWLAQQHESTRHDNKYKLSVAHQLAIKISQYTRNHAKAICELELRITDNLDALTKVLEIAEYQPYLQVFDRFGFGLDNKILLLYHIYPFDKFLISGKPWVERDLNDEGKLQKRDRSLRKFQAFLGMSFSYRQSGDSKKRKFHGSSIVRSHLYAWAVCQIAPASYRIKSDVGTELSDRYQELRVNVKGKDALIRILFKATRMLYRELCRELIP